MTTSPNALCFGDEFPATGRPCHVVISVTGLTVRFDEDVPSAGGLTVPFSAILVSAGGLNHDQLVVKWGTGSQAHTLYLKDPALIAAFRTAAPPELTADLEKTAAQVRRVRSRHRTLWAVVLGVVGALALFLWFGSDLLVELAVDRIPVEWEQKLGESAYRDFLTQQTVIKEGPAVTAVQEMTHRLTEQIPNHRYTFEVTVVKSDVVNAFALPGGYVVVFTGLMKKAESGEEVAGVLGHELNHVLQRHGLERIVKQLGLVAVVSILLGDQQGLVGLMKQIGVELLSLKFGRAQETEADVTGLQLLHRAKIDPSGMVTFFQRLSDKEEGWVEWLSTHPMSAGRAERLKAEIAALPKNTPEPFTFTWKTVQESLGVPLAPAS
jgi:Zn-dependent protease with chaperone function